MTTLRPRSTSSRAKVAPITPLPTTQTYGPTDEMSFGKQSSFAYIELFKLKLVMNRMQRIGCVVDGIH